MKQQFAIDLEKSCTAEPNKIYLHLSYLFNLNEWCIQHLLIQFHTCSYCAWPTLGGSGSRMVWGWSNRALGTRAEVLLSKAVWRGFQALMRSLASLTAQLISDPSPTRHHLAAPTLAHGHLV